MSSSFDPAQRFDLTPNVGRIHVSGADAFDYLQRMVSADLREAALDRALPSTLLTPKGRIVAFFEIFPADEAGAFELIAPVEHVETLVESLGKLVILEDVAIESRAVRVWSVQGSNSPEVVERAFGAIPGDELGDAVRAPSAGGDLQVAVRHPRGSSTGFDLYAFANRAAEEIASEWGIDALEVSGPEAVERERVVAGVMRFGVDVDHDNLPPEVGLESAASVSKGCYVGQEVISRIHHLGHPNKRLRRLEVEGFAQLEVGAEVYADFDSEKSIGRITSTATTDAGGVALGFVAHKHAEVGATVTVALATGGRAAAVVGSATY